MGDFADFFPRPVSCLALRRPEDCIGRRRRRHYDDGQYSSS